MVPLTPANLCIIYAGLNKTRRGGKRWTQARLAKEAKVTQSYIAKLESGDKKNPSVAVLKRLAKALGVPMTELLG